MKRNSIYKMLTFSAALSFGLFACQDEVMVEVPDNTKADALLTSIATANETYVTMDKETGDMMIENAKLEKAIDSLYALKTRLNNPAPIQTEYHYTVNVLSTGNAEFTQNSNLGRTKGVAGATVVVEQNGQVLSPSSEAAGLYLFKGLREGYVFVKATAPDHTTVEYRAYLGNSNSFLITASVEELPLDVINASTQILLYPNAGALAGKISGKAFANTSILNDTLGRTFGSDVNVYGALANTHIGALSKIRDYYYYENSNNDATIYSESIGEDEVNFESAKAGHIIYAFPELNEIEIYSNYSNSYIVSMVYRDIITSTTIAADGTFTLPVIAANETQGLINEFYLTTDNYMAGRTRLTEWGNNYEGGKNETGSTEETFKYFNNSNSDDEIYSGTGNEMVIVAPGTSKSIKRRTITETVEFRAYFPEDFDANAGDDSRLPRPGETLSRNVYFVSGNLYND